MVAGALCGIAIAVFIPAACAASPRLAQDLADLTLEQLANIEVTSVSRRPERLADAAASVFVITGDDIRRTGVTSLPEALRLAPNLQVARADNAQYSITARGFNSTLANKMLVLIDGRTVYSPLFSGVFWEAQDVMLEDVERIEVISGPGGTLWGSNAVNGVINVITRAAKETQGALLVAGAGNKEQGGAARYGGAMAAGGHYRVYGKSFNRSHSHRANGTSLGDGMARGQAGFRADWDTAIHSLTVQGDAYASDIDQGATVRQISGVNLLGRSSHRLANGSNVRLQAYYDRTERDQPGAIRESLDTVEVGFQQELRFANAHEILWGVGYRYQGDRVENISPTLAFRPANRTLRLASIFAQDEIALRDDVALTVGLKLEHNNYTGLEFLPNVRLAWKPADNQLIWTAVSRTVRVPSRIDRELFVPANPPFLTLAGGAGFEAEVARVVEVGYRAQPWTSLSFSVTAFHHAFDRLRSVEPTPAGPVFGNLIEGETSGVEAWGTYRVASAWRLSAGVVNQSVRLRRKPGSADITGLPALGNDPRQQLTLRSSFDLGPRHELDVLVRHVGALPNPVVPSYTAVDARLGWRLHRDFELSLTAQNLFDSSHPEWGAAPVRPEFERGVFLKLLWRL